MYHPKWRFLDPEPVQKHIGATVELDELRPDVRVFETGDVARRHRSIRRPPMVEFADRRVLHRIAPEPFAPLIHARSDEPRAGDSFFL